MNTSGITFAASARRACTGAAVTLLLVAVVAACGAAEETPPVAQVAEAEPAPQPDPAPVAAEPAPAPQPAPESAPAPQPAPESAPEDQSVIEFWDFDASSVGRDLAARLTPEETACLEDRLGADFAVMLSSPLAGQAGESLEGDGSGSSPFVACLTEAHVVSARVSMLAAVAGGFSAPTWDCLAGLLREDPAVVAALAAGDGPGGGSSTLRLISCLAPEEAAALTPPEEGPAPNPDDISCIFEALAGEPSGERILAVLSGDDPAGEGLTIEESAVLGRAVEACGVETGFGFPDATGGPLTDDSGLDSMPADLGGGWSACTPGLILHPGDGCHQDEFSVLILQDGSALLDGDIGGISMGNTVMDAQSINLNGLIASRSGGVWTIESLP